MLCLVPQFRSGNFNDCCDVEIRLENIYFCGTRLRNFSYFFFGTAYCNFSYDVKIILFYLLRENQEKMYLRNK